MRARLVPARRLRCGTGSGQASQQAARQAAVPPAQAELPAVKRPSVVLLQAWHAAGADVRLSLPTQAHLGEHG